MIGTQLYQNKQRVLFLILTYGLLAAIGVALIVVSLVRKQDPNGAAGFMVIFGAGMSYLTWSKSRKPRIVVGDDHLELRQQRTPQYVKYKSISLATRTKDERLILEVRDGHSMKSVSVWLKDLEKADADAFAEFCLKKKWKSR